jgi:hypothetical protein
MAENHAPKSRVRGELRENTISRAGIERILGEHNRGSYFVGEPPAPAPENHTNYAKWLFRVVCHCGWKSDLVGIESITAAHNSHVSDILSSHFQSQGKVTEETTAD